MDKKTIKTFREELLKIQALELCNQGFLVELMRLRDLVGDLLNINIKLKKPFVLKLDGK